MDYKTAFYNYYFELLINRITHSNLELEMDLGNPDSSENAIRLMDNMEAFKILVRTLYRGSELSEELIMEVASTVNKSSLYISDGYRKIGKYLADTDIPISRPENIRDDITKLLYAYKNSWDDLNVFEKEAKFHIEFIRIHPFEDGNGRTARLLLCFNLLKQNVAPSIITTDLIPYYQSYIRNIDIKGMARMLEIQSQKEDKIIGQVYEKYTNIINIETINKR